MNRTVAAALLLVFAAVPARSAAVDDANAAVLAAKVGHYDDAVLLFSKALRSGELSDRGRAQALSYRGISRAAKGDYAAALEDLDSAVALNSAYGADAYSYRGFLKFALGRSAEGAADLDKGADLLIWPYNALWLYVARAKAGIADKGVHSLANNIAMLDVQQWPGPLLGFYQGGKTAAAVRTAAEAAEPATRASRVCDANFYIGEYELAQKNPGAAKPLLEAAAKDCPYSSFERVGATAELSHWGK